MSNGTTELIHSSCFSDKSLTIDELWYFNRKQQLSGKKIIMTVTLVCTHVIKNNVHVMK